MKTKLETEKITENNQLSIEEQQHLLNDLLMVEALVVAYENYCKSIGKFKDAVLYVKKFIEELENDQLRSMVVPKDGEA